MKNTASMVASTVCSGLFLNLATADQYISIILTGNMFSNVYAKKGYESRLLSRTTEDAVTVTSPAYPMEHLRHDASHHFECTHTDLPSLLLLQPYQSGNEYLYCCYRI